MKVLLFVTQDTLLGNVLALIVQIISNVDILDLDLTKPIPAGAIFMAQQIQEDVAVPLANDKLSPK